MDTIGKSLHEPWGGIPAYLIPLLGCIFGLVFFELVFGNFFSAEGTIGHDYALALPTLLDSFYWYLNNGSFSPPWFTPGFCAGIPAFSDPQSGYFSVFQILTFLTDPLRAVHISILLYAGLGYIGMHLYARQTLRLSMASSSLAAGFWMLNGFYSHRMIVGHLGFIGVALIPLLAWLLIGKRSRMAVQMLATTCAGLLIATWVHSGLGSLLIPSALAVWGLIAIALLRGRTDWRGIYLRSLCAALLAAGLAASKLNAAFSTMAQFPRTQYPFPGFASVADLLVSTSSTILLPSELAQQIAGPNLVNGFIYIGAHEWAFTLTPLPVVLILAGYAVWLYRRVRQSQSVPSPTIRGARWLNGLILVGVLLTPLAIQFYSPEWNALLKQIPIIKSSVNPWRWMIIWLPLLCVGTGISVDFLFQSNSGRIKAMLMALAFLGFWIGLEPRGYYEHQGYDPKPVVNAYYEAREVSFSPRIDAIGHIQDKDGNILTPANRNDLVINRISQAFCYNPLFGYGLEKLDLKSIGPGPVMEETNGLLNIINPACYTFPSENGCKPGDAFKAADRPAAEDFVNYRHWNFRRSERQRIADAVSGLSIVIVLTLLIGGALSLAAGAVKDRRARDHSAA